MANTIITKNSSTASAVPTSGDLVQGELAVNVTDKRLFTEDSGGNVVEVGTNPSTMAVAGNATVGGTLGVTGVATLTANPVLSAGTANGVAYLNGSKVLTSGSALTFDGTNLGVVGNGKATSAFAVGDSSGNWSGSMVNESDTSKSVTFNADPGNAGANSFMRWNVDGSEQMRLTSTGLGIGTSSPGYKLDVNGSFRVTNGTNPYIALYNGSNTGYVQVASGNLDLVPPSGGNTTVSSGNLGLGVTPSAWNSAIRVFQLNGTSSTGTAALYSNGANGGIVQNAFFDTGWKYIASAAATRYDQTAGSHAWSVAPSGTAGNAISFTQAMTLTAAGDLMVGLTSVPSLVGGGYRQLVVGGSSGGVLDVGTTTTSYGRISGNVDGLNVEALGAYPTVFRTNSTERARIDSSGNLLVGTTTLGGNGFTMYPNGSGGGIYCIYNRPSTTNTTTVFSFQNGGSVVGSVSYTNTATSYNTSSDYRLKENIQPMTGALAKVAALKPCTYKWKSDGSDGEGFIAHELAEVVPQCVTGEKDAVDAEGNPVYQGIDTSFLVATLTAAIQEQQAIINAQQAALEQLKARLDAANL